MLMLRADQIQELKAQFRITDESPWGDLASFQSVQALFDPQICRTYLEKISEKFQTTSLVVVASQFAKRYSYLLVVPTLYAMSVYHKGLPVHPNNCYIQSYDEGQLWLPRLALADWQVDQPIENRARWREQLLRKLFAGNVAKVWAALQQNTGIQPAILWENTTIYIQWIYQQFIQHRADSQVAEDDLHFLLHQASPELFGAPFQPLQKFASAGNRKTCCLYYLTNPEQSLCKGCPRQRIRKRRSMVLT